MKTQYKNYVVRDGKFYLKHNYHADSFVWVRNHNLATLFRTKSEAENYRLIYSEPSVIIEEYDPKT